MSRAGSTGVRLIKMNKMCSTCMARGNSIAANEEIMSYGININYDTSQSLLTNEKKTKRKK